MLKTRLESTGATKIMQGYEQIIHQQIKNPFASDQILNHLQKKGNNLILIISGKSQEKEIKMGAFCSLPVKLKIDEVDLEKEASRAGYTVPYSDDSFIFVYTQEQQLHFEQQNKEMPFLEIVSQKKSKTFRFGISTESKFSLKMSDMVLDSSLDLKTL